MGTFCIDYFQICGQSPNFISRILWALFRSSITIETFCSPLQSFFCKWGQMPNFGRLKPANEHILHRLFPNLMQISQIHFAYMVGIMSELHYHPKTTTKNICSPFALQRSAFNVSWYKCPILVPLKSADKHILDRLFPNLWQIPKLHLAYMVGIMSELNYHQKYLLSNSVLFLEIGAKSNCGWLKSANGHILHRLFPNLWPIPKLHLAYIVGIIQELYHHRNVLLSTAELFL